MKIRNNFFFCFCFNFSCFFCVAIFSFYIEKAEKYFGDNSTYNMAIYKWSNVEREKNYCGIHKHKDGVEHFHKHEEEFESHVCLFVFMFVCF